MKTISVFLLFFISFFSFASDIIQGPFHLDNDSDIAFQRKDENVLFIKSEKNRLDIIDTYEPEGEKAQIETVFFTKLEKIRNVIVLISWKQYHPSLGIDGVLYEIKGYSYINGRLKVNESLLKDNNLSGFDGVKSDNHFVYKYKNAETIKEYLNKNH
ncbi:hypothetical protein [Dickeya fangzhongdai]|uniref:hypothetical protein n=1 Tax=Dickeya fangzhongdai TaxID=1778540 RepID=UPI000EAF76D8|nr:hypothetical protein [Dickeya fangzhongdai]AYH46336.1 hypothetical protein B6N31_00640 [Dickeya fangzhongdai]WKV48909.1 hypothetical protein PL145_12960 [Dickeya fangzhongdai]